MTGFMMGHASQTAQKYSLSKSRATQRTDRLPKTESFPRPSLPSRSCVFTVALLRNSTSDARC